MSIIIRFVIIGLLWLALVVWLVCSIDRFTLLTAFWIVASAIIVFMPLYKKYIKDGEDR